jgi:hypothetical protein
VEIRYSKDEVCYDPARSYELPTQKRGYHSSRPQEHNKNNMSYLLKARIVEPEEEPLLATQHSFLGNGRETNNGTTSVAEQQTLYRQE